MMGVAFLLLNLAQQDFAYASKVVALHRSADERLVAGDSAKAIELFGQALGLAPTNSALVYGIACAKTKVGDVDGAFEALNRAAQLGYRDAALVEWDPDLARLRSDARFAEIVATIRKDKSKPPRLPDVRRVIEWRSDAFDFAVVDRRGAIAALAVNATQEEHGEVVLLDAATGARTRSLISFNATIRNLAFDSGGTLGVLTSSSEFNLISLSDAKQNICRRVKSWNSVARHWPFGTLVAPSPDGKRWLVASGTQGAELFDEHAESVRCWDRPIGNFLAVPMAWSRDGRRIAAVIDGAVHFFDGSTGDEVDKPLTSSSPIVSLAFDPMHNRLATGHEDSHARVWDLDSREKLLDDEQQDDFKPFVAYLAFSPDGKQLAYSTAAGVFAVVLDLEKHSRVFCSEHMGGRMGERSIISWSSDGKRIWHAFESAVMVLEDVDLASPTRTATDSIRSGPVHVGDGGIALSAHYTGVLGLDSSSGRVLWIRANVGARGELLHTATGYFTSDFDDFTGLNLQLDVHHSEGQTVKLAKFADRLFDPKRVRAARAGVDLFPPDLR